jgi:hypothetical protein
MPSLSGDLPGLFAELAGLSLGEHSEIAVPLCLEDLMVHRHRLLAQPPRMVRQLSTPLTYSSQGLVDVRADFSTGTAVQRRAHVPFDVGLRLFEPLPDAAIGRGHGHLHDGLGIQELTRGADRACRFSLRFLNRASCRSFHLPHRCVERGLAVPSRSA